MGGSSFCEGTIFAQFQRETKRKPTILVVPYKMSSFGVPRVCLSLLAGAISRECENQPRDSGINGS